MSRNILFIIDTLEMGGSQKILIELATYLTSRGSSVFVVCLYNYDNEVVDIFRKRGIRVYFMHILELLSGIVFFKISYIVKSKKINFIQTFLFWANWIGGISAFLAGHKNIIYSVRGVNTNHPYWKLFVSRITSPLAKKIVINSEAIRDFTIKYEGVKDSQLILIYNGINCKRKVSENHISMNAVRDSLKIDYNAYVVGYIGRLSKEKGVAFLLQAARMIMDKSEGGIIFLIVGDGKEANILKEYVSANKMGDRVTFLGLRMDTMKIIIGIDVLVLPSLTESMPNSIMEAMLVGKTVIASRVGGVVELVKENKTGFLVPPQDPSALAEKIIYLRNEPQIRSMMGEEGKKRIHEFFSLEDMLKKYETLYKDLH